MGRRPQQQTLDLFIGIGLVLVVATIRGRRSEALRRARCRCMACIDNLRARINAWWVMVAVIGVAFLFGRAGVMLLFFFASFAALREFITLTYTRRADHDALATSFYVILPLQYVLIWTTGTGCIRSSSPSTPSCCCRSPPCCRRHDALPRADGEGAVGADDLRLLPSHVPALLNLHDSGLRGTQRAADRLPGAGRAVERRVPVHLGQALRRRKIAPAISPSKTVEGLVGGGCSATILGAALWWITPFSRGRRR